MNKATIKCQSTKTNDLNNGDIVITHGAVCRLTNKKVWPADKYGTCVTFNTEILNDGGTIPKNWLKDWTIQGNERATWNKIIDPSSI